MVVFVFIIRFWSPIEGFTTLRSEFVIAWVLVACGRKCLFAYRR